MHKTECNISGYIPTVFSFSYTFIIATFKDYLLHVRDYVNYCLIYFNTSGNRKSVMLTGSDSSNVVEV